MPSHPTTDVIELIGNPRAGSRTRTLADATTSAVTASLRDAGVALTGSTVSDFNSRKEPWAIRRLLLSDDVLLNS